MSFKVEVKLKDASIEAALEPMSFRHFPFFVDNGERDVLIWNPCTEANRQSVCRAILLQIELGRSRLVSQLWVKDVELVALDDFGGRIFRVIVSLVVLVPFVALLHRVEETWLAHHEKLLFRLHEHAIVGFLGILCRDQVCELLFIRIHALLLGILKHLH